VRYRLAKPKDLEACRTLLPSGFRSSIRVRERLVDLWRQLLTIDPTSLVIIEDPSRAHPSSIEAFAARAFVTDAFADACRSNPRPYLSALIYEGVLAGQSPVLSTAQICHANSSTGLNQVVLHFGLRNHDLSHERTQQALRVASLAFYFFHAGYRL
jgi:hypothetical protein